MEAIIELGFQLVGIVIGLFVGGFNERRHVRTLQAREGLRRPFLVTNLKRVEESHGTIEQASMVTGQVVIASDYFKSLAARLRNLVGGEMHSVQTLLDRARREALARLLDEAELLGATEIWNVRYQFTNVSMMRGKQGALQVEMLAYGTAVRRAA